MPKEEAVIHSFPGIGKFTTETIKAYQERGWLVKMLTTIVIHKDMKLVKVVNSLFPGFTNRLKNRNFSEVPTGKILLFPYKELMRLFAVRFLYFSYRMLFKLGILDGAKGIQFHYLHALWFRKLIDKKIKLLIKNNK